MRKVGDAVIAADSALGIVFGLAVEFLRGAAASGATICQRLAEQRSEPSKLLAATPGDSPITQRCADIRDGLVDAPVSHADLAACITGVWVGGTHLGYIWADPIASSLLADYRITKK
ncbi:hypothetical protein [Mycobacteroides abscessus]|uniref:Uncharacterized protein n=1 Tax=Mycobacteroides abscessus subsp. massiliense TaxID=1962118 RepID=A0A1U0QMB1_9MYCO|nr:hypothetical protein [Mycobacteroides abscessus]SKL38266.1 Uncharacterised protein [Mycobacteroides abscessus subsp. massiliense]SKS57373.1 Uncharacterised protein [Mycobacteroides abscessus subsp. massiliense]SKT50668.1 Uncharacterised protein [Mycobacteroides abscessus subsp. massiliense]SKX00103.1 Uncharacterised protein [Mycobacteroides abscessus subsp. massiliense]